MRLTELISAIEVLSFEGEADQDIAGIAYHSKSVEPGFIFVAIPGLKTDGHIYIDMAISRGAKVVLVEKWHKVRPGVSQIIVSDARSALARISRVFFGVPTSKLKLIGVTGTNGKTTTAKLIESILQASGVKTGLLGTIEYKIGDRKLPVGRTTPESFDLQNIFNQMLQEKVQVAVMEVSSHAVDLHRTDGCQFDALVFTNLSQDHLDYHGTLEKYFEAKNKLFVEHTGQECVFIINADDVYGQKIAQTTNPGTIYYGLQDSSQVNARDVILGSNSTHFVLESPRGSREIDLQILGLFNVYNALAAASVGLVLDQPLEVVKKGLEAVENIPGRFEVIECGQNFSVVVDYAHTPDGLKKLLSSARAITKGRLITIFGCGGDRDVLKRPLMGEVVGNLSDYSIVTSDNSRSENPDTIIGQIEKGLRGITSDYILEVDRKKAIYRGIELARENDCVIIAGKGHETYQEFKDKTISFDDRAVAREALEELTKCSP